MANARRTILIAVGVAVGAVLIGAAVSLVQGPGVPGTISTSLGLKARNAGVGAPQMAPSMGYAGVAAEEAAYDAVRAPMPPISPEPGTAGETAAEVEQRIIKNGSLQLVVDDVSATAQRIAEHAASRGGFVQSSSVTERADGTHAGHVTVRVPVAVFETSMADIKALAKVVSYESATGQDVTEQYTDLEARLRNARAQEETYLAILVKADTVEDILMVQERLGSIRGVIESLEGRIKYLENQTALATISISLEEEPVVRAPTKEFRPGSAAREAVQSLVELFQNAAIALIWLAIVGGGVGLPILLVVIAVLAVVKRLRKSKV
jgi:hypothetical protein